MVSVIIPVLNEGATIRKVIRNVRQSGLPLEIIVVDDNSTDNTIEEAMKESVRIVTSSKRGKGLSMREGLLAAKFDTVVYLDGDITTYPPDVVDLLAGPILNEEADFVKSTFKRQAGRVTQLVAKPLLSILFPDLAWLEQPLSGMIAGKKSLLEKVNFEKDYGVDIGLLIDMHRLQARIREVNIGQVKNAMQSLEQLGKMSREVSRTILNKADALGVQNLATIGQIDLISRQMESSIRESIDKMEKMVLLEMDRVVLQGNFPGEAAQKLGLADGLEAINKVYTEPAERQQAIATLFAGTSMPDLLEISDEMPLVSGIRCLVANLKKRGYAVGLVAENFSCVANHLKNTLGLDFVLSNHLKVEDGIITGEWHAAPWFINDSDGESYQKCHMFTYIANRYGLSGRNIIYVSGNEEDQSCIEAAGIGRLFDSGSLTEMLDPGTARPQAIKPASLVLPAMMTAALGVLAFTIFRSAIKKPAIQAG